MDWAAQTSFCADLFIFFKKKKITCIFTFLLFVLNVVNLVCELLENIFFTTTIRKVFGHIRVIIETCVENAFCSSLTCYDEGRGKIIALLFFSNCLHLVLIFPSGIYYKIILSSSVFFFICFWFGLFLNRALVEFSHNPVEGLKVLPAVYMSIKMSQQKIPLELDVHYPDDIKKELQHVTVTGMDSLR